MNSVSILPIWTGHGGVTYCAVSNGKRSEGATAGQALDALRAQLTDGNTGTLVIIQNRQPDQFFTAGQQSRLAESVARRRGRQPMSMS